PGSGPPLRRIRPRSPPAAAVSGLNADGVTRHSPRRRSVRADLTAWVPQVDTMQGYYVALLLALTTFVLSQPAGARAATAAEREVREAARAVVAAFERGDLAALAARIDPDYRGVTGGGAPIDAPRALQAAKQLFAASRARRLRVAVVGLRVQG